MKGHLRFVCPAALLCVWVSSISTAQAQIYALREKDGTLVLSDKPLGPDAQTFAVNGSGGTIRTTAGSTGRSDFASAASRVSRWDSTIEEHAAANRIRPELVRAVIQVESAYNPRARSHKGAMGLMQLMPGTAADLGVVNPYDPEQNIRGGVAYLRMLLDKFGGNEELALAAYNAGPGAVSRYGDNVPPYRETQQYVDKVRLRTSVLGASNSTIYKVYRVVDGREVVSYSGAKPPRGTRYEIVVRQRAVTLPVADDGSEMR